MALSVDLSDAPDALPRELRLPVQVSWTAGASNLPDDDYLAVFEDPLSHALLAHVKMIARSDANALLLGEAGTGKEFIARRIHTTSARRLRPFVAVNCGAYPESQVEGELFGCEKGAMAGAFAPRAGWFEAANGGTLFLDEVDRLAPPLQVRLLRLLHEHELLRVGSRQPVSVDLRLVAASGADLERAVRDGQFREDLYHALRVAHLVVPALRHRRGDILPLARHFLLLYGERMNFPPTRLAADAEAKLLAHHWPGNLRELENVIHHALVISADGLIGAPDLSLSALPLAAPGMPAGVPAWEPAARELETALSALCALAPAQLFRLVEHTLVRVAFRHCRQHQVKTARLLGVSRNVLRSRLIEFGEIDALK